MKSPSPVKRAGRPTGQRPKRGTGGKGRVLTVNVSAALRRSIEGESAVTGRSMSQVAEKWMDEARKGRAAFEQIVGGFGFVALISLMGQMVREICGEVQFPTEEQREALQAAWAEAVKEGKRFIPAIPSALAEQVRAASNALADECATVLALIDAAGAGDPVYQVALEKLPSKPGTLSILSSSRQTVADVVAAAIRPEWDWKYDRLKEALTALPTDGTAGDEIKRARALLENIVSLHDEWDRKLRQARQSGQAVAQKFLRGKKQ